jgi:hypothetical protein
VLLATTHLLRAAPAGAVAPETPRLCACMSCTCTCIRCGRTSRGRPRRQEQTHTATCTLNRLGIPGRGRHASGHACLCMDHHILYGNTIYMESFPITDRTMCLGEMIPKSGFWCKVGVRVSFRNPLAKLREGGLWGLKPSAIPHLTPYIDLLHNYPSMIPIQRKSWVRRVGFFFKRAWQVCCERSTKCHT